MCLINQIGGKEIKGYVIVLQPKISYKKGQHPTAKHPKTLYVGSIKIERELKDNSANTIIDIVNNKSYAAFFEDSFEYVSKIADDLNKKYQDYNAIVEPSLLYKSL